MRRRRAPPTRARAHGRAGGRAGGRRVHGAHARGGTAQRCSGARSARTTRQTRPRRGRGSRCSARGRPKGCAIATLTASRTSPASAGWTAPAAQASAPVSGSSWGCADVAVARRRLARAGGLVSLGQMQSEERVLTRGPFPIAQGEPARPHLAPPSPTFSLSSCACGRARHILYILTRHPTVSTPFKGPSQLQFSLSQGRFVSLSPGLSVTAAVWCAPARRCRWSIQ